MATKVPFKLIKIKDSGYHLHQFVKINGKKARLIIDTGASNTILDKNSIEIFTKNSIDKHSDQASGIGGDKMDSFLVDIEKIEFGSTLVKNHRFGVLDLSNVNNSYKQLKVPQIHGILGSDLMKKLNAVIDYKTCNLHLNFTSKKSARRKK